MSQAQRFLLVFGILSLLALSHGRLPLQAQDEEDSSKEMKDMTTSDVPEDLDKNTATLPVDTKTNMTDVSMDKDKNETILATDSDGEGATSGVSVEEGTNTTAIVGGKTAKVQFINIRGESTTVVISFVVGRVTYSGKLKLSPGLRELVEILPGTEDIVFRFSDCDNIVREFESTEELLGPSGVISVTIGEDCENIFN